MPLNPHKTKYEFIPRDNLLRPPICLGAFLTIDYEKHVYENIDEWLSMICMTT